MLTHVDELHAAGLNAREIARRAHVAPSTLSRARQRGVSISRIVERAVLAVEP
jgi:hypothetical protein